MRRSRPITLRGTTSLLFLGLGLIAVACTGTSEADVGTRGPTSADHSSTNSVADAAPTRTTTVTAAARTCAESLPPERLASQLVMVLVRDPDAAGPAVAAGQVGGYALQGDQRADFAARVKAVADRNTTGIPLFVASDEEGGAVQRLRTLLGRYPAQQTVAQRDTPEQAGAAFEAYARRAGALGVTMILGPVLDVGGGAELGSRSFGTDPDIVATYGRAVVDGIERAGLVAVVKHWPGLGSGTGDPHTGLTRLPPLSELEARDLVPFRRVEHSGVDGVMVTHAVSDGLTDDGRPVSRSPAALEELRGRQDYGGLVITDALGMGGALAGTTQAAAATDAVAAGVDVAMLTGTVDVEPTHARLTEAITSGRLPRGRVLDAVARVLALKGVEGSCQPS